MEPDFLEREREKVFGRTWQWVGRSSDVSRPGDYFASELAGEPVVVTRDEDGELRGFFNVCRHRGGPVASGKGNGKLLQCAYHGWTYGLDGKLRRAPEMEGVEGVDPKDVCLPAVRVEEWAPLVFAHFESSGPSFCETVPAIADEVESAGFPIERMHLVERREYVVEANWKVYVDNYLEGYHIPLVHPALFREVDYENYRIEAHRFHATEFAPLRPGGGGERTYPQTKDDEKALFYWVFPNLMLNFYPGNLQLNSVIPLDRERTLTVFEWYGLAGKEELEQAIAFSHQVQLEDMEICRAVQKGLRSRSYDRGRLSVRRENGVHHFHLLLHEHLTSK
ncbi:MAG: aromatic ring-hydroxylating oxygenase subunit alpha [Vicinamibacteria bacterium]